MKTPARRATVILVALAFSALARAEDWPHWRGPRHNGVAEETDLPIRWSTTDNIAWKTAMPAWSGSTPIIWGNRIFVNVAEGGKRIVERGGRSGFAGGRPGPGRRGERPPSAGDRRQEARADTRPASQEEAGADDPNARQLALWCLDRDSGEVLWRRPLDDRNHQERKQNMSSPSPVTDGSHVWVMTGTGILKAFDFEGNEMWSRDIQADYGAFGLNWGYASSPLLHEDRLFVQVLHGMKTDDPSYLLGIDKSSGKTLWRVERPTDAVMESPDSYTTPALLQYEGKTEIVISGGDYVTGHDPNTGEELWRAGGLNPEKRRNYRIVASPLVSGNLIVVPTRQDPMQAFRAGGRGDVTQSHLVWATPDGPDVPTPVTDGKYLYVLGDQGVMRCFELDSGVVVWGPERVRPGIYSASPVLAGGKIYVTSEEGVTTVISAGPRFEVIAENDLAGYTLASPAVSGGHIYIRTEEFLYAITNR